MVKGMTDLFDTCSLVAALSRHTSHRTNSETTLAQFLTSVLRAGTRPPNPVMCTRPACAHPRTRTTHRPADQGRSNEGGAGQVRSAPAAQGRARSSGVIAQLPAAAGQDLLRPPHALRHPRTPLLFTLIVIVSLYLLHFVSRFDQGQGRAVLARLARLANK